MRKRFIEIKSVVMVVLLLIVFFGFFNQERVQLYLYLEDDMIQEDQWIYWFSLKGNEDDILDSCFIPKGQKKVILEKEITEIMCSYWLTFSKVGPLELQLVLTPGEQVELNISASSGMFLPSTGSYGTEERYNNVMEIINHYKNIKILEDSLLNTNINDEKYRELSDSIEYYKKQGIINLYVSHLDNIKHPQNHFHDLNYLIDINPNAQQNDSLIEVMKQKYPTIPQIQEYRDRKIAPATERGEWVANRQREIISERLGRPIPGPAKDVPKIDVSGIQTLKLHDYVDNMSLPDLDGNNINLSDFTTEYVLIDFWAAWCGPCRKEFPQLKQTHRTYQDVLSIYAVSLDRHEKDWKNAIVDDRLEQFTHGYIGDISSELAQKINKRFGVKAIPANFLLDKNRHIIATNLRGKALEEKMVELVGVR